jgi:hypothetical protein
MRRTGIIAVRGAAVAAGGVALLLAWLPTSSARAADGCPNEARRIEQSSTYLANCGAYELVSPSDKDSGEPHAVQPRFGERQPFEPILGAHAAVDGERMAWHSEYALPGVAGTSSAGVEYLSTRGPEGWSTEATVPPQSSENGLVCPFRTGMVGWSSNLTKGILDDGAAQELGSLREVFAEQGFDCGHDEPRLVAGEPEGFQNLFLRDSATGSYQLVNVTPHTAPHPTPNRPFQGYVPPTFLAGSVDLSEVVFEDELPLTEESEHLTNLGEPEQEEFEAACKEVPKGRACWEGHGDLYVWSEAAQPSVRLVSVLPNGEPVRGTLAGSVGESVADYRHAVSADGSRIFFEAEGNLYTRENGGQPQSALDQHGECTEPAKACTIQLDLPQGGKGAGGGGKWLGANVQGTKVFFTDEASNGLTSTTIEGSGSNLYEYELPSEADAPGRLVDLTPDANAEVLGVSGVSEDGSNVYFVADGALPASGENSEETTAEAGQPNLYVSYEGATKFVATLDGDDRCDWTSSAGCNVIEPGKPADTGLTARVSGNGRYLAFNSVNSLTHYDNVGPACVPFYENGGFQNKYLPGSCEEIFLYEAGEGNLACVSCEPGGAAPSAGGATIDWAAEPDSGEVKELYPQRNVSESGQVFFETAEALLPRQDTNGIRDVYEYEHSALHLISSGTSNAPSYFLDASADGSDVFFATAQKLLPRRDTDAVYDVYDARVDGGFPEPASPPLPCESEGCAAGAAPPAVFSAPDSATFAGPGNVTQTAAPLKPKSRMSARARKLVRALRVCRKDRSRKRRASCERQARKKYDAKPKGSSHATNGRR